MIAMSRQFLLFFFYLVSGLKGPLFLVLYDSFVSFSTLFLSSIAASRVRCRRRRGWWEMERRGGRGRVSANIGDGGEMFEVGGEPNRCEVALKLRGKK